MTLGQFQKHDNSQAHTRCELSCMKCHKAFAASLSCDDLFRSLLLITVERKQNKAIHRGEEEIWLGSWGSGDRKYPGALQNSSGSDSPFPKQREMEPQT